MTAWKSRLARLPAFGSEVCRRSNVPGGRPDVLDLFLVMPICRVVRTYPRDTIQLGLAVQRSSCTSHTKGVSPLICLLCCAVLCCAVTLSDCLQKIGERICGAQTVCTRRRTLATPDFLCSAPALTVLYHTQIPASFSSCILLLQLHLELELSRCHPTGVFVLSPRQS